MSQPFLIWEMLQPLNLLSPFLGSLHHGHLLLVVWNSELNKIFQVETVISLKNLVFFWYWKVGNFNLMRDILHLTLQYSPPVSLQNQNFETFVLTHKPIWLKHTDWDLEQSKGTATDLVGNETQLTIQIRTVEKKEKNQSDLSHLYYTYKKSPM